MSAVIIGLGAPSAILTGALRMRTRESFLILWLSLSAVMHQKHEDILHFYFILLLTEAFKRQ